MRSGQRLVSITFIESYIADEHQRTQVYELNEIAALEGLYDEMGEPRAARRRAPESDAHVVDDLGRVARTATSFTIPRRPRSARARSLEPIHALADLLAVLAARVAQDFRADIAGV